MRGYKHTVSLGFSAINAKEITVVFNNTVDKTTSETATNYVVPGKTVIAVLGADAKTVTLTTNTPMTLNVETKVKVSGVKSADKALTVETVEKNFTPVDETIPSVVNVTVKSPTTIVVEYSEPVNVAPATTQFTLDNAALPGGSTVNATATNTAVAGYKSYTITLSSAMTVGEHKLVINADNTIVDYAGFILPTEQKTLNVVADTLAPKVENIEVLSRTEIQITFNKDVNVITLNGNEFFWNTTNNSANAASTGNAGTVAGKVVTKVNERTFKVPFTTNPIATGEVYIFANRTGVITDITGNPFPLKSFKVTVPADAAPTISNVVALSDTILEVTFNKAMNTTAAAGLADLGKYVIKNSTNQVPNTTDFTTKGELKAPVAITPSADQKVATIVLSVALPADTYTLTVAGIKDVPGVAMESTSKTFSPVDTTPPAAGASLTARIIQDATGDQYIIVTFPEAMAVTGNYSVLDKAHWQIRTNAANTALGLGAAAYGALHANATVTADSNAKIFTIRYPAANALTASDYAQLQVTNVADMTGNIQTAAMNTPVPTDAAVPQVPAAASTGVSLATDVVAKSFKVTGLKTIEFKLNKGIQTLDMTEFEVLEGATVYDSTTSTTKMISGIEYKNNDDGTSTVTISMNKDLDLSAAINVKTKNPVASLNSIDADGLTFAKNATTASAATVDIKPTIQSAALTSTTTIAVQFDQNIAIANQGDFTVLVDEKSQAITGVVANGKYIVITLTNAVSIDATPIVKTAAQDLIQSEATNGQKIAANTDGITAKNIRVQSFAWANGEAVDGATAGVGDKLTITFTDAVNPLSLGFVSGNKQADGSYKLTAAAQNIAATAAPAGNDTATIGVANATSIGTITFNEPVVATNTVGGADGGDGRLDATLSADGKTLTLTFTAVDATATLTKANFNYSTFVPAAAITDANGNPINTSFSAMTSTKF